MRRLPAPTRKNRADGNEASEKKGIDGENFDNVWCLSGRRPGPELNDGTRVAPFSCQEEKKKKMGGPRPRGSPGVKKG